jgi:hypothetical protein
MVNFLCDFTEVGVIFKIVLKLSFASEKNPQRQIAFQIIITLKTLAPPS